MPPSAKYQPLALMAPCRMDSSLIGDHQIGVDLHEGAQTGTLGTGAVGVIEGEHPGRELLDADAVLRTGVVLGKGHVLAADHVHHRRGPPERPVAVSMESARRRADLLLDHQPVHHDLDGVLLVLLQLDLLGQIVEIAVHPHPDITGLRRAASNSLTCSPLRPAPPAPGSESGFPPAGPAPGPRSDPPSAARSPCRRWDSAEYRSGHTADADSHRSR